MKILNTRTIIPYIACVVNLLIGIYGFFISNSLAISIIILSITFAYYIFIFNKEIIDLKFNKNTYNSAVYKFPTDLTDQTIISNRAPTKKDKGKCGQTWLCKKLNNVYIYSGKNTGWDKFEKGK